MERGCGQRPNDLDTEAKDDGSGGDNWYGGEACADFLPLDDKTLLLSLFSISTTKPTLRQQS